MLIQLKSKIKTRSNFKIIIENRIDGLYSTYKLFLIEIKI